MITKKSNEHTHEYLGGCEYTETDPINTHVHILIPGMLRTGPALISGTQFGKPSIFENGHDHSLTRPALSERLSNLVLTSQK